MPDLDLNQQTFLITGASSGIGRVAALELAARGAEVLVAGRSRDKHERVIAEIAAAGGAARFLPLDLADLASVRSCARELLEDGRPLAALINNAGMAGARGLSKDGFELTFATNHLGPYLLTRLLLDHLKAHAPARIVNVASKAHYRVKTMPWGTLQKPTKTRSGLDEYSVSKLCNVLFTKELARRLTGTRVTTYSLHPGVVATDVWRAVPGPLRWVIKRLMISPQEGAQATLLTATAPQLAEVTGRYYDWDGRDTKPSDLAEDAELAAQLWKRSAAWVGLDD
jgi:NAD(P)-dependent dehydrogenase (short-subunit alcohol dehydrogenase family)